MMSNARFAVSLRGSYEIAQLIYCRLRIAEVACEENASDWKRFIHSLLRWAIWGG